MKRVIWGLVVFLTSAAVADAGLLLGHEAGGNGNHLAGWFKAIGVELVAYYRQNGLPADAGITVAELEQALNTQLVLVNDRNRAMLENKYGEIQDVRAVIEERTRLPLVFVDEPNLTHLYDLNRTDYRLVMHAYVMAAGKNDDNYRISAKLRYPTIDAKSHGPMRRTLTGATFRRRYDHPELGGEVWMDPNGLIWGDAVRNASDGPHSEIPTWSAFGWGSRGNDGELWIGDQTQALEYCLSIGATLPSDSQFRTLFSQLGGDSEAAYLPQVLPNLRDTSDTRTPVNYRDSQLTTVRGFWSLTISHGFASVFYGSSGHLYSEHANRSAAEWVPRFETDDHYFRDSFDNFRPEVRASIATSMQSAFNKVRCVLKE